MATANRRGPWLPEEDQRLLQLVHTQGPNNWVRISQNMQHRSPKQCRERFHQNLKQTLNHEPISPQEGQLIEQMVAEIGKRWAEIARRLGNRSDNAVKNWWNGSMNRRRRNVLQHAHALKGIGGRVHPIPAIPLGGCATRPGGPSPKYGGPRRVLDRTVPLGDSRDGSLAEAVIHMSSPRQARPPHVNCHFQGPGGSPDHVLPSLRQLSASEKPFSHTSSWLLQVSSEHIRQAPSFPGCDQKMANSLTSNTRRSCEPPLVSPAATDVSHIDSFDRPPSLVSDNNSSNSISPRTMQSPTLPAPIHTGVPTWSENSSYRRGSAPTILPRNGCRDFPADEGYVSAIPASAASDVKHEFPASEHGPYRHRYSVSTPTTASSAPPACARDTRMNFSSLLNAN